ncbi:MAG: hypothetical protein AAF519_00795 [Bacteroidota bacterium]
MKKILFLFVLFPGLLWAQDAAQTQDGELLSKRGYPILPQAGDFGIGFDAVPFLEYAGNLFSGSTSRNSVSADFQNSTQQLVGKYFLDESTAIRARFRFRQTNDTDRNRVILDNQATPDPFVEVVDERQLNSSFFQFGAGLEKRRGQGRLYGIYGGEVFFTAARTKSSFEYGNPMTASNQRPTTTTNFSNGANTMVIDRDVEVVSGRSFGLGINGFAGIEYFFAPKMGISAEFTYGFEFSQTLRGRTTDEFFDVDQGIVRQREFVSEGGSNFTLDTGNFGGAINLFFYF